MTPGGGYPQGWGLFAGPIGLKPDHIPCAPYLLRLMCPAGGGGPNSGRAWVAQNFADVKGGPEYEQFMTHATLLDARIGLLGAAPLEMITNDPTVEIHCSEIAALDFLLRTGDEVGAGEIRAMSSSEGFASSLSVRKNAYAATKNVAQNKDFSASARRGSRAKGGGRGNPD